MRRNTREDFSVGVVFGTIESVLPGIRAHKCIVLSYAFCVHV